MGSASSKFKKYLQHGDEYAAMQVFQSSPELRKNLDPNLSYGDHHNHNTALHYAAKHGMKHLLRTFLNDLGGNPNKKNAGNETSLHMACQLEQQKSLSAQERRAACVTLLLQWRGVFLPSGEREKVDQLAQDQKGNSALHSAAQSGLQRCVELLVAGGSPLFTENNEKSTPCDLAMQSGHHDIAQFLETKMVFADNNDTVNEIEIGRTRDGGASSEGQSAEAEEDDDEEEVYSGLRTQDLQEAKDQLLVETADMLHIPLFTAEALLRDNEWSREALLEKWMKEPVLCCQLAGVQPPASALQHSTLTPADDEAALSSPLPTPSPGRQRAQMPIPSSAEVFCEICASIVPVWDEPPVKMSCEHRYCASCWEKYLTVKIQDGDAHHILCPAFECPILVPVDFIEKLVSPEMARRYLQFDIKAFVETNRSIKWCPMPGCGRAVRLPTDQFVRDSNQPVVGPANTSHAVDCGNGHFFCWECLGDAHAPCGCAQWQEWQRKINEVRPEELKASCSDSEDAANCLWLVTNSKPCPNCKSPIQKNEGCNHMKCSKCKFDFCWVCLESWKKHSSATGGYFRCNRFEAVSKLDEKQGAMLNEATQRNKQLQELTRFLHYYTRFRNHENSQRLESPLLGAVHHKMELLAASLCRTQPKATTVESGNAQQQNAQKGTKFIEDGVRELLKARRVLCGSYVFGYYLEDNGSNKTIFEFMQNELEEVTEKLSEMVARAYLRTPRSVVMQTTALARRKRHEFVRAVDKGLVPPETPPAVRREQLAQALVAATLKDLDPVKGWINGRPTPSVPGYYDWPIYESDEEESDMTQAIAVSLVGQCSRPGCSRPRARNPRTGAVHEFCSLRCSKCSRFGLNDSDLLTVATDMDLVIALEMSRLQMIEDEVKKQQREQQNASSSHNAGTSLILATNPTVSNAQEGEDHQLKLAIQLSLQESQDSAATSFDINIPSPLTSSTASSQPSTVDLTVDYFLRSLACCDLQSFESYATDQEWDHSKQDSQSSAICFQSTSEMEDGRFEIGELHENGGRFAVDDDHEHSKLMRRSHSTGDLCTRPTVVTMCSYFDSDHSQHEDKPEELGRRNLRQAASAEEDRPSESSPTCVMLGYAGQSSIEDTSDSLNADLEVCGILGTTDDDSSEHKEDPPPPPPLPPPLPQKSKTPPIPPACTHSKIGPSSSLRIRICKSPKLDTDSSNEYESETGIPKSPTLFISGVSISRTPEPRSPALAALSGRQSRSSSLTVPVPPNSNTQSPEPSPKSPLLDPNSCSPRGSRSSSLVVPTGASTLPSTPTLTTSSPTPTSPTSPVSPNMVPSDASPNLLSPGVSKSANEPEREKEMFRFPKSSTDGALSSVLLVQESNLSSDDFHEALFLEKSPKSSKRRKRSKKDRNKENGMESMPKPSSTSLSTPVTERRASKETSSIL